eukprot:scaffold8513_cov113-Skeletonema_dohrnii-CCMP3373.AAC.3
MFCGRFTCRSGLGILRPARATHTQLSVAAGSAFFTMTSTFKNPHHKPQPPTSSHTPDHGKKLLSSGLK